MAAGQCIGVTESPSNDQINVVELESNKIRALELVWHPLKYPSLTRIEFQIRLTNYPWLVLFTNYDEDKARSSLESIASLLGLPKMDRTFGAPAKDIDRQYRLKKHENREASKIAIWATAVVLGIVAATLILLIEDRSIQIAGYIIGSLAVILVSGQLLKPVRKSPPEKYRRWIK